MCGWQPRQAAAGRMLVQPGRARLRTARRRRAAAFAGPGRARCCAARRPERAPPEAAGRARRRRRGRGAAVLGGRGAGLGRRRRRPRNPPGRCRWRRAGRRGWNSGRCRQADSPLAERDAAANRFRRGQLIHALLQHLPALPAADAAGGGAALPRPPGRRLRRARPRRLADEVLAVLAHPELAPLFGPEGRAEVPLTGVVGGAVVGGLVDRLAVLPDRVLVADYKTNRAPARRRRGTPVLYLRQMASYRAVLRAIFPGRQTHACWCGCGPRRSVCCPTPFWTPRGARSAAAERRRADPSAARAPPGSHPTLIISRINPMPKSSLIRP